MINESNFEESAWLKEISSIKKENRRLGIPAERPTNNSGSESTEVNTSVAVTNQENIA